MRARGSPVRCQVLDAARDPVILGSPRIADARLADVTDHGPDPARSRKPEQAYGSPLEPWKNESLIPGLRIFFAARETGEASLRRKAQNESTVSPPCYLLGRSENGTTDRRLSSLRVHGPSSSRQSTARNRDKAKRGLSQHNVGCGSLHTLILRNTPATPESFGP